MAKLSLSLRTNIKPFPNTACLYKCIGFPGAWLGDIFGKADLSNLHLWCNMLSVDCILRKRSDLENNSIACLVR